MDVQVINPVGGIKLEIDNPNHGIKTESLTPIPINEHVKQLARWAVETYGKEKGLPMALGEVISASSLPVFHGMLYYIMLYAANKELGLETKYEAIVLEKRENGLLARKLLEFNSIDK